MCTEETEQNAIAQTKLSVSGPNDPYEQEADAMADRVMRMSGSVSVDNNVSTTQSDPSSKPGGPRLFLRSRHTDRFLLAATQNGVPLSQIRNARRLYQRTQDLLPALRRNAQEFRSNLSIARADMNSSIDLMLPAVRRNSQEYLASQLALQASPPAGMIARSETALMGQRNRLAVITNILLRNYLRRNSLEGESQNQDINPED